MAIDPSDIVLTPMLQQQIADIATRDGRPWSEVLAEVLATHSHNTVSNRPTFGGGKGLAVIYDDFDAPLSDFEEYSK